MTSSPDLVALSWDPAWAETLALAVGRIGRRAEGRPASIAARELRKYLVALARTGDDDLHRHRLAVAAHGVAELTAPSRRTAEGAVRAITDSCVETWRELIDRGLPASGAHLAEALKALAPTGRVLGPLVDDLLESRERRLAARATLVRFGSMAAPATPRLVTWLEPDAGWSVEVRKAALDVLAATGPAAEEASGALKALLVESRNPVITSAAARALIAVIPEPEALLSALIDELTRPGASDTRPAEALVAMGTAGRPAVPMLAARLTEVADNSLGAVVRALERLGPDAAPAVKALVTLLQRGRRDITIAVVRALGCIGPAAASAVPLLIGADDSTDPSLQEEIVGALESIGQTGDGLVADWLSNLLTFEAEHRRPVSIAAARALCVSASAQSAALRVLLWHLRSGISDVEANVIASLRAIGPAAVTAVPELVAMLDDERLRSPATRALGAVGPTAHTAAGPLVRRLEQASASEAPELLAALTRIGAATVARSAASQLLRSPASAVRVAAAAALTATGGPDLEDASHVADLLSGSPPPRERQALERALAAAEDSGLRLIGSPSDPGVVVVIPARKLAARAAPAIALRWPVARTAAPLTALEVWSLIDRVAWASEWSGTIQLLAGRLAARGEAPDGPPGERPHLRLARRFADHSHGDDLFRHRLLLAAGAIAEIRIGDTAATPLARRVLAELSTARDRHAMLDHVALVERLDEAIATLSRHDRAGPGSRRRRTLLPLARHEPAGHSVLEDAVATAREPVAMAVVVQRLLALLADERAHVRREAAAALAALMTYGIRVFPWAAPGRGDPPWATGPVIVTTVAALARRGAQSLPPLSP